MPIINNLPGRSRTTQEEILLAFADRLREHPLLNDQNVVVSDQAVPSDMPGGGFCICIAPGDGRFPGELWNASHHSQATEDGTIIVGIYTKIARDRRGRKEFTLFSRRTRLSDLGTVNADRPGLLRWKREILKLLLVGDLVWQDDDGNPIDHSRNAWEPSKDGKPLLRDTPSPQSSTGVMDVPGFDGWVGLQLTLSVAWDWDLYCE